MARLNALRYFVPVTARSVEEPNLPPPAPTPDCGGRWGRPGNFGFTVQAPTDNLADNVPRGIIGAEIQETNEPIKRTVHLSSNVFTAWVTKSLKVSETFHEDADANNDIPAVDGFNFASLTWKSIENITFLFVETLPKKHLGQLGNPKRTWDYNLSFRTNRPDDENFF